jgi:isoleucyl-tRNA synthetase
MPGGEERTAHLLRCRTRRSSSPSCDLRIGPAPLRLVAALGYPRTDALEDEGLAREILSRVQDVREELSLAIDGSERARRVAEGARKTLIEESLASQVVIGAASFEGERREANVDGEAVVRVIARGG